MEQHFEAAPWSVSLTLTSAFAVVLLCVVAFAAYRVVPYPPGFTHEFGTGVAILPLLILAVAVLFAVTGYTLSPTELGIRRLLWTTAIPLDGLQRVAVDPSACKGSVRLFGNAGLFAFTGWYWNRRLGRYRLFATDFRNAVVLTFAGRSVVISPGSAQAFVDTAHHFFPATRA